MKTTRILLAILAALALASCGTADFTGPNPLDTPGAGEFVTPQRGHHGLCGPNYMERMQFEGLLR